MKKKMVALCLTWILCLGAAVQAGLFKTIDFETAEGYPAADTGSQNLGAGPDFPDTFYNVGANISVWSGGSYGVPSGSACMYYDAAWWWSYARTNWQPVVVPAAMSSDRYLSIEYSSLVTFSVPVAGNEHIPPVITFGLNGFEATPVAIYHNSNGDATDAYKVHLVVNGAVQYEVSDYTFQQWRTEKLVYDKLDDTVTYYYNGIAAGTYALSADITSFDSVSLSFYMGNRSGAMAIDNIRFSTVPEPMSLTLLALGGFLCRRTKV
jgi:hypothetical protein